MIANNPNVWRLYQHLAYIYWRMGQYNKAAEFYQKGSAIAGAPQFMKMMAAAMTTQGGSRETARAMYREMLGGADPGDAQTIHTIRMRLLALDAVDEQEAIRAVLADVKQKTGRCATNFKEILPMLRSVKLPEGRDFSVDEQGNPADPTGAAYLFDPDKCDVKLDPERTKLPLR